MPDAYRAAPPRRAPHVIETRSILPRTLLSVWAVATVVLVALSQRVVITCEREPGGGVCSFRSERLFWSSDWKRVPIAEVERARVEEGDGTSRVTLVTKRREVPLVSVLESGLWDEKAAVVDAVNQFLRAPEAPRLTAAYGSRWAADRAPWMLITAVLAALASFTRKVRVIVDHDGGVLNLDRPRFPWGRSTETFLLETVSRAVVEESSDSDGSTYRVALIQSDGTVVPLTRTYDSGRDRKDRAVDQINAALADRA